MACLMFVVAYFANKTKTYTCASLFLSVGGYHHLSKPLCRARPHKKFLKHEGNAKHRHSKVVLFYLQVMYATITLS
jgi:hypothetical protein